MPPSLSVVIVNYNTCEFLRACLRSLQTQSYPCEVIVVDNASKDASVAMVQAEFPDVKLLAQSRNTWFCGGNNMGNRVASGDYVLMLNPDTVVHNHTFEQMVNFLHQHPDYAGVTCQLVYPNGDIQRTCASVPSFAYLLVMHSPFKWLPIVKRLADETLYADWNRDSDRDVACVPGSCTLVRKADAHLDERLRLYFCEEALGAHLQKPFRFISTTHIEHFEKSVTRSWFATDIYFDDLLIYTANHHGTLARWLMWGVTRPLYWGMWLKRRLFTG
jgi:GT2 family glycosyltransferase